MNIENNNEKNRSIEAEINEVSNSTIPMKVICGNVVGADEEIIKKPESFLSESFEIKLLRGFEKGASSRSFTLELSSPLIKEGDVIHISYDDLLEEATKGRKGTKQNVKKAIKTYVPLRYIDLDLILDEAERLLFKKEYTTVDRFETLAKNSISDNELEGYENEIINYIKENPDQVVDISSNTFEEDKHIGVFLDEGKYRKKHGENSIALTIDFLADRLFIEGELNKEGVGSQMSKIKRGEIIDKLIERGFIKKATNTRNSEYMNLREDESDKKMGSYIFNIDKLELNNSNEDKEVS